MHHRFQLAIVGVDHPHASAWRSLLHHNFADQIDIVAIVPAFHGATASLEERYADTNRFETVESLVQTADFDGALVCLPNNVAGESIVALAAAGKHILAEKPVLGSATAAQPIASAVAASGIAFQTGYTWRYEECANRLRRMITDGSFGKLISIEMTFVTSDVARRGVDHYLFDPAVSETGFFNWLACHFLDLLLYTTGRKVTGVTARTGVFGNTKTQVEDGGVAILDLDGGAVATFVGGYWMPRWAGEHHWTIRGSERWVKWHPNRPGTAGVLEIHGPQPQWFAMEEEFAVAADDTIGYGGRSAVALVQDWLDMARGKPNTVCRNGVEQMISTLQLVDAIYQASSQGKRIACEIGAAY